MFIDPGDGETVGVTGICVAIVATHIPPTFRPQLDTSAIVEWVCLNKSIKFVSRASDVSPYYKKLYVVRPRTRPSDILVAIVDAANQMEVPVVYLGNLINCLRTPNAEPNFKEQGDYYKSFAIDPATRDAMLRQEFLKTQKMLIEQERALHQQIAAQKYNALDSYVPPSGWFGKLK